MKERFIIEKTKTGYLNSTAIRIIDTENYHVYEFSPISASVIFSCCKTIAKKSAKLPKETAAIYNELKYAVINTLKNNQ